MSRSSIFLATSSVTGLQPLQISGQVLLLESGAIRAMLRDKAPELDDFFAEAVVPKASQTSLTGIAWYCSFDQNSHSLDDLSERRRSAALTILRQRLLQALALIDDPDIGPALQAMLIVPSPRSVRFVGNEPVLIDWAVAPASNSLTPDDLQSHFDSVFGPMCGITWPRTSATAEFTAPGNAEVVAAGPQHADAPSLSDLGEADASATESGSAPNTTTNSPNADAGTEALSGASASGSAGATDMPEPQHQQAKTGNISSIETHDATTDRVSPHTSTAGNQGLPWHRRGATGLAIGAILLALIGGLLWWLLFAPGALVSQGLFGKPPHEAILDSLRAERDRLRNLTTKECGPELLDAAREGFVGPLTVPPLPPSVEGTAEASPTDGSPIALAPEGTPSPSANDASPLPGSQGVVSGSSLTTLARNLEHSVVMVVGSGRQGLSMGTGFFIAADTLVTNRHVVEAMDPDKVMITSQFLGAVRAVSIVAMTRNSEIGEPDYAILRLRAPVRDGVVPLSIVADAPKLARVVTAGYPAYIAQSDPQLHSLLGGNSQAAPSMVFTSGEVSVVQGSAAGTKIIVHTADMSQGSSGGPLVDACGRVTGVNTFIGNDDQSGRRGLYSLAGSGLMSFLNASNVAFQKAESECAEGAVVVGVAE